MGQCTSGLVSAKLERRNEPTKEEMDKIFEEAENKKVNEGDRCPVSDC